MPNIALKAIGQLRAALCIPRGENFGKLCEGEIQSEENFAVPRFHPKSKRSMLSPTQTPYYLTNN